MNKFLVGMFERMHQNKIESSSRKFKLDLLMPATAAIRKSMGSGLKLPKEMSQTELTELNTLKAPKIISDQAKIKNQFD